MPTTKLTVKFVRDATALPGKKRTIFWDETLPTFGSSVNQSGHKSYVLQYRAGHGQAGVDRRMTLKGTTVLEDARRHARTLVGQIVGGEGDPLQQRRDEQQRAAPPSKRFVRPIYSANTG